MLWNLLAASWRVSACSMPVKLADQPGGASRVRGGGEFSEVSVQCKDYDDYRYDKYARLVATEDE
jgi:hypothetical protein